VGKRLVPIVALGVLLPLVPLSTSAAEPVAPASPLASASAETGQTKTVLRDATLSATGQDMWGGEPPDGQTVTLFHEAWDESASLDGTKRVCLGISEIDFEECGRFGADLQASVSGEIGMSVDLEGFDGGTLSVTYPVTVELTAPADSSFDPGEPVDITTSMTVDAEHATIVADFPGLDSITWNGVFALAAEASARMCFISCDSRNLFSFDEGDGGEILNSGDNDLLNGCWNLALNIALGGDTYPSGRCNDGGYLADPDVTVESTLDPDGSIVATGADQYVTIPLSGVTWATRFTPIPWYVLLNLNPVTYKDVTIGWTSFNAVITALATMEQDLRFTPSVELTLDWGDDLPYQVLDGATGALLEDSEAGAATFAIGDTLRLTTDADRNRVLPITPTLSMGSATMANHTRSSSAGNLELRALSFTIETDRWRICVDGFGCETVWPSTKTSWGPVHRQDVDLGSAVAHTIYDDTFDIGGFEPVVLEPFDLVPRPVVEVRKAIVPAIAPGSFDLLVDGVTVVTDARDGATTGRLVLEAGTRVVAEAEGADADLRYYDITITCVHADGGAVHTAGAGASPGLGSSMELELTGGEDLVCTIQNRLPVPAECDAMHFDTVILGTPGADVADVLVGTTGNDVIVGYGGNDVIAGGPGDDCLAGNDGDDVISGGSGDDVIDGGSGRDVCSGAVRMTRCE
jgi:Ca2+-binding RTX toxin-like protein